MVSTSTSTAAFLYTVGHDVSVIYFDSRICVPEISALRALANRPTIRANEQVEILASPPSNCWSLLAFEHSVLLAKDAISSISTTCYSSPPVSSKTTHFVIEKLKITSLQHFKVMLYASPQGPPRPICRRLGSIGSGSNPRVAALTRWRIGWGKCVLA